MHDTDPKETFERVLVLRSIPLFKDMAPEQLAMLAEVVTERRFRSKEQLARVGDTLREAWVVMRGSVLAVAGSAKERQQPPEAVTSRGELGTTLRLSRPPGVEAAEPLAAGRIGPHQQLGLFEMLAEQKTEVDVWAEARTRVLALELGLLYEVLEDNYAILSHLLRRTASAVIDAATTVAFPAPSGERPEPSEELHFVQRLLQLRHVSSFQDASVRALVALAKSAVPLQLKEGDALWHRGEPSDALIVVVSGTVRVEVQGPEPTFVAAGQELGGLDLLADRPREHTVVADQKVTAMRISANALVDVFEDHTEAAMGYLRLMAAEVCLQLSAEAR